SSGAPMPAGTPSPMGAGDVILLSAEDDPSDTIRPRLELAGAVLGKIHHAYCSVKFGEEGTEQERLVALSEDLGDLVVKARELKDVRLIVIDPITNYLGPNIKINQEEDIRRVLMPLVAAAKELNAAVVMIGHFNKRERGSAPLDRIMGARAFAGVSRFI